ncbi:MAG: hypothetical protein DMF06_08435 [Verrucomicrobia bacterium]|nr:MAG: hypothetical protein DMF06_08435 [Verrucomicrobiota bacterium]
MFDHPIILIIVVAAALLRWLSQRSQASKETDPERPQVPGLPIPRGGETQTEEERIRRFLEALGQPTTSTPPRKVTPRPAATKVVRPNLPPLTSPLPPLVTVPPPLPPVPSATVQPAAPPPPPPRPIQRIFTPAPVQEASFEVRDLAAQTSSDVASERPTVAGQQGLLPMLRSAQGLRSAIVLREIFGPPRGLQTFDPVGGF